MKKPCSTGAEAGSTPASCNAREKPRQRSSLADWFGSLDAIRGASVSELAEVDGVGEIIAESVAAWFTEDWHVEIVERVLKGLLEVVAFLHAP